MYFFALLKGCLKLLQEQVITVGLVPSHHADTKEAIEMTKREGREVHIDRRGSRGGAQGLAAL
jgi:hypothetical protein